MLPFPISICETSPAVGYKPESNVGHKQPSKALHIRHPAAPPAVPLGPWDRMSVEDLAFYAGQDQLRVSLNAQLCSLRSGRAGFFEALARRAASRASWLEPKDLGYLILELYVCQNTLMCT